MPVLRITNSTWDRLKEWAVPLEDTSEDAVRKVLDAADKYKAMQEKPIEKQENYKNQREQRRNNLGKLPKGKKTPQGSYRDPILKTLSELGGSATVREALEMVEKKMRPNLLEIDYEMLPSGVDIRWRNTAMWARYELVQDGFMKSGSTPGIWEISDKGRKYINNDLAQ